MSSYFHSAAMTLLSKTLQTLLYKYLSDVDVEGVALPSLYDTDGHSGWGVRLSNVKLREGVKLMDLPGRRPKRKQPPAPPKNSSAQSDDNKTNEKSATKPAGGENNQRDTAIPTEATPKSGTDNDDNFIPDIPPPLPPKRSSSWFSWSYSSSSRSQTDTQPPPPTTTTTKGVDKREAKQENAPSSVPVSKPESASTSLHALSVTEHTASLPDLDDSRHSGHSFEEDPAKNVATKTTAAEEEKEPPMRLRLGKDGTIGILDVRLVGKELHVVVEDADLVVEAVVVKPSAADKPDETPKDAKVKPTKKMIDPETIGDRILAENGLAKIFSMIPNLFLRDIRVKFVLRDEPVDEPDKPTEHESPHDTTLELSVELLSVTDGQDFFAHVREEEEDENSTDEVDGYGSEKVTPAVAPTINEDGQFTQNEYLTKRIRTGRGPEGGIVLKIYPGVGYIDSHVKDPQWARQVWYSSSDWCALRCSGLDVHARIFMGNMKEMQIFSATESWYGDTELDEYTVDSMLFGGVDYIQAPDKFQPLPPMPENAALDNVSEDGQLWTLPGATTYRVDANGIQSSFVNSSFHRVARGMRPVPSARDHLPSEYSDDDWEGDPGVPQVHSYDMAAPLGGLVVNAFVRDPLEVNMDRPTLEIIGLLQQLFKKPGQDKDGASTKGNDRGVSEAGGSTPLRKSNSTHSYSSMETDASSLTDGKAGTYQRVHNTNGTAARSGEGNNEQENSAKNVDYGDISSAFPSYMSPEKVSYIGGYVQEIIFRVHLMREERHNESGYEFSFWQMHMKCLTFDQQVLSGNVKPFKDIRLDCGFMTITSFKGNEHSLILSAGVRPRVVEFDDATVETLMTRGDDCQRPPWPATSTVLLDIPPPLESLVYESRERHALQIRFIALSDPSTGRSRSLAHLKVGTANVNMPYASIRDMLTVIKESRETITPAPQKPAPQKEEIPAPPKSEDRLMKFKLQLDGARVNLPPLIDVRLPMCSLRGDRSTVSGLHFETVLEKIQLGYGRKHKATIMEEKRLSLQSFAHLPEQLRMRILLCLDDLNPLACALGMKSEENSFLRCRSINKRIVKVAHKQKKRRPTLRIADEITRRQFLMQELTKLDDEELEDLYETHQRRMRRYRRNSP